MENNTLCNRHSLGVNNHTKMYVTYTRIYGWSDYGGESSYQPGYRLENMMWMTLLVYDYIIPGEKYNYTSEKIDSIISAYEDRIKEYIAYLRKMYLEEESLLMKVTDEIKEECSGYAEFLGLDLSLIHI